MTVKSRIEELNAKLSEGIMSISEESYQYAQERKGAFLKQANTVAEEPDAQPSDVTNMAIRDGVDVVYGEEHSEMAITIKEIQGNIEQAQEGDISAVILEIAPSVQGLLDSDNLQNMTEEGFVNEYVVQTSLDMIGEAEQMRNEGIITENQFHHIVGTFEPFTSENAIHMIDSIDREKYNAVYDMAIVAAEKGVPVIAGDTDRQRAIAGILAQVQDEEIRMNGEKFMQIMKDGLDDTSDIDLLHKRGVDLDTEGSFIIHRGLHHIIHTDLNGGSNGLDHFGIDDILEGSGRPGITVAIIPSKSTITDMVYDNVDYSVKVDIRDNMQILPTYSHEPIAFEQESLQPLNGIQMNNENQSPEKPKDDVKPKLTTDGLNV